MILNKAGVEAMTDTKTGKLDDQYIPGVWRCAKCEFRLILSNLHADTGTVTARNEPGAKCPNCDSPLWRVTWKQDAMESSVALEDEFLKRKAAEQRLSEVEEERTDLWRKNRELHSKINVNLAAEETKRGELLTRAADLAFKAVRTSAKEAFMSNEELTKANAEKRTPTQQAHLVKNSILNMQSLRNLKGTDHD